MPKRALTVIVLAVALTMAVVIPASAKNDHGNQVQEIPAVKHSFTVAKTQASAPVRILGKRVQKAKHWWSRKLRAYQQGTWYRERLMDKPLHRFSRGLASAGLYALVRYTIRWKKVARRTLYAFRHPPLLSDWLCIHHYEGAWNDPGGPYWGGLQMDLTFQQEYGGWLLRTKGTADRWTPMEQIWVALRAYKTRGFSPWPNTARACGLL